MSPFFFIVIPLVSVLIIKMRNSLNVKNREFREEIEVRELIKLQRIYELLEEVTDKCEDVANLVEGIVLENS